MGPELEHRSRGADRRRGGDGELRERSDRSDKELLVYEAADGASAIQGKWNVTGSVRREPVVRFGASWSGQPLGMILSNGKWNCVLFAGPEGTRTVRALRLDGREMHRFEARPRLSADERRRKHG